jgi:hypothetical protein
LPEKKAFPTARPHDSKPYCPFLDSIESGPVADTSLLEGLLANCWDDLSQSSAAGMEAYKLHQRMEDVRWQPPILFFVIERHGGTVLGSTRAELQHWEVDLDKSSAEIVGQGHRQLKPMAPKVSIRALADEIAGVILADRRDDRIWRLDDGSVSVNLTRIFPADSGFQRTVESRRQRLIQYVGRKLGEHGWQSAGKDAFRPPPKSHGK